MCKFLKCATQIEEKECKNVQNMWDAKCEKVSQRYLYCVSESVTVPFVASIKMVGQETSLKYKPLKP